MNSNVTLPWVRLAGHEARALLLPPATPRVLDGGERVSRRLLQTGACLVLAAVCTIMALAPGRPAHATTRTTTLAARHTTAARRADRARSQSGHQSGHRANLVAARRLRSKGPSASNSSAGANLRGKVAVFPFWNDDDNQVSSHVAQLLTARGLEVVTGLRRVDSAEQYRDMATHLGLAAYVDGDVYGGDARAQAIVRLRSGFTGRRLAEARFTERRTQLRRQLSERLWSKLARPMARACSDATRPRKRGRTMHINAGTPIETTPRGS
jgi:hypothetical protein